jgi:glucan phosphoethanolaminetransferase (alkaline phosphatase superfamily)
MGYFVFIFSIISLALSIPALIFGRISKKGVIVNVNRSRRGNTLSLISLIASIVLIILGLIVLIVAITKTGTSSYNYYNYF